MVRLLLKLALSLLQLAFDLLQSIVSELAFLFQLTIVLVVSVLELFFQLQYFTLQFIVEVHESMQRIILDVGTLHLGLADLRVGR